VSRPVTITPRGEVDDALSPALPPMPRTSSPTGPASDIQPYLSVVATARNDDHGGNPLYRMQLFVDGLIAQCDRYQLPAELVLVEWNPPADRPRLADSLQWPANDGWCTVRIVEVPTELHSRLEHADRLPLFQMIGKNVGIRRARGTFVLATNIDILFSDELMELVAAQKLDETRVYRVDRVDVPAEIDISWPIEQQLAFCRDNAIRINYYDSTVDLLTGERYRIYHDVPVILRVLPVWLQRRTHVIRYLLWRIYAFFYWIIAGFNDPRAVPTRIRNRLSRLAAVTHAAEPASPGASHASRRQVLLRVPRLVMHVIAAVSLDLSERRRAFTRAMEWEKSRLRLHTNASGDFTLMSSSAWLRSAGYAEFEMYSMHIDGLHLYTSHYSGIREQRLRAPVYHIEHGGGFKPNSKELDERLERDAIPQISNDQLMGWIYDMYKTRRPVEFNRADWGFAEEELPETTPLENRTIAQTQTEVA
jgi:hypothetical protein